MARSLAPERVALVGLMGAGKSRVGRLLAAELEWPFHDLDRLIEARRGRTVAQLFQEAGEGAFRDAEAALLAELAATPPPLVAALGGGIVERPDNRRILRAAFRAAWIEVTPDEAARRVGRRGGRPLLAAGRPREVLEGLERRRRAWYAEVASIRVSSTAGTRAEELVRTLVAELELPRD